MTVPVVRVVAKPVAVVFPLEIDLVEQY